MSFTGVTGISTQIGFGPKAFKKLQSCLVAAEAACSKGDFPVVAVEIALAAVEGLAIATETAALPAELAAVVAEAPRAINGAAQPIKLARPAMPRVRLKENKKADRPHGFDLLRGALKEVNLFLLTDNIKDSSRPRSTYNGLKFTIRSFVVRDYLASTFISRKLFVLNWAVTNGRAVVFIDANN